MEQRFHAEIGGKTFSISSGKIAKQASGAVIVQLGETMVLVTVVSEKKGREGLDFLPLTVEYQEKIYSAGRIPGNYFRREIGRPSEKEVLTCRLIDRPIRPLFPKGYYCETQVICTVLSMDRENEPDILAMVGTSAALSISDIPFEGPIAAVRVARVNGELIANPTIEESKPADINIVLAGNRTGVIMVEAGAKIVSEADMLDAIEFGHKAMQPLIDIQEKLVEALGKPKRPVEPVVIDEALYGLIKEKTYDAVVAGLQVPDKMDRRDALSKIKSDLIDSLGEAYADRKDEIGGLWEKHIKAVSREIILEKGHRIDGRAFDEIRPITCEVGVLPRTHGSALFTRGETQVLGVVTLGSGNDEQRVETLSGDSTKPFMLHYNFPPFSVGEVKRIGGPGRREIGHGALAHRAIEAVLPERESFDYVIRIVSEVTESNGSSSMGTVCSGTLALMDGGVPIKAPVSGIAMGLVKDGDKIAILSDILGDEDHTGDMDFKVAGTRDGITALQMDIKIKELSKDIMVKALEQARMGRIHILDRMLSSLGETRPEISKYAPKAYSVMINKDKIRDIIGPGGKIIRQIQADTNTTIEVNDDGLVKIHATSQEDGEAALRIVTEIGTDPEPGTIYDGVVSKTTDFGAFVTIKPGTDGLVHISELANYRVKKVTDIVKEGDTIRVKVLEVTRDGKIRLSYKAAMDDQTADILEEDN
ncbi:polyribonucleotide nucleotidyltransferase [Desulfatiferula olefinivorans]